MTKSISTPLVKTAAEGPPVDIDFMENFSPGLGHGSVPLLVPFQGLMRSQNGHTCIALEPLFRLTLISHHLLGAPIDLRLTYDIVPPHIQFHVEALQKIYLFAEVAGFHKGGCT